MHPYVTAKLLAIAKIQKQPQCPSREEWIKKTGVCVCVCVYIYIHIFFSVDKVTKLINYNKRHMKYSK